MLLVTLQNNNNMWLWRRHKQKVTCRPIYRIVRNPFKMYLQTANLLLEIKVSQYILKIVITYICMSMCIWSLAVLRMCVCVEEIAQKCMLSQIGWGLRRKGETNEKKNKKGKEKKGKIRRGAGMRGKARKEERKEKMKGKKRWKERKEERKENERIWPL